MSFDDKFNIVRKCCSTVAWFESLFDKKIPETAIGSLLVLVFGRSLMHTGEYHQELLFIKSLQACLNVVYWFSAFLTCLFRVLIFYFFLDYVLRYKKYLYILFSSYLCRYLVYSRFLYWEAYLFTPSCLSGN